ncbi:MAG: carboxypeptidase M32 [Candidatus Latescibacteria bacterium]|nr:carboxypeptidase M32 [Candidatus Latescibacterota bacterium]
MGAHYDRMIAIRREVSEIHAAVSLMEWDQETYMPRKGGDARSRQLATLSGIAHARFTSDEMGDAIHGAATERLNETERVNLREIAWSFDRARRVPTPLVKAFAETGSKAVEVWREARPANDFATFAPWIARLVDLRKEYAEAVGYAHEPYDALLEDYEPGASTEDIARTFEQLRGPLVDLVQRIQESWIVPRTDFLSRTFPIDDQRRFAVMAAERMGFDAEAGRLDVSPHPFCTTMSVHDVRLTTRYSETMPAQSLFGVIHEAGHGLYEQGFDPEHEGTPAGTAVSLGIHESQSRLWENLIGRSRAFWRFFFPQFVQTFPSQMQDVSEEEFYAAINRVAPSLIRVEADEVTYNLHILLRFEIERDLFKGTLSVNDLPAVWNARMRAYLGLEPPCDRDGVLQDIHWAHGSFGYFPTYTLGNLYAAQFFDAVTAAMPGLLDQIARGELLPLREWLREHIHRLGMTFRAHDLVQHVTGQALSSSSFIAYLQRKFGELYRLNFP